MHFERIGADASKYANRCFFSLRRGECVQAREAAVSFRAKRCGRDFRREAAAVCGRSYLRFRYVASWGGGPKLFLDCACAPGVLNGRARSRGGPPPRIGGFLLARSDGSATSAAKRWFLLGPLCVKSFDFAWTPCVVEWSHEAAIHAAAAKRFCFREAMAPGFPPRRGGCVYARDSVVSHGRMTTRRIITSDSIWRFGGLESCGATYLRNRREVPICISNDDRAPQQTATKWGCV